MSVDADADTQTIHKKRIHTQIDTEFETYKDIRIQYHVYSVYTTLSGDNRKSKVWQFQ